MSDIHRIALAMRNWIGGAARDLVSAIAFPQSTAHSCTPSRAQTVSRDLNRSQADQVPLPT